MAKTKKSKPTRKGLRCRKGYSWGLLPDGSGGSLMVKRLGGGFGETGMTFRCKCQAETGGTCEVELVGQTLTCGAKSCKDCTWVGTTPGIVGGREWLLSV